jgi:signal transduction histidine kinase
MCYEDNGCGTTPSALTKLFEALYTTKRGKGGSGLGASLVYHLVTHGVLSTYPRKYNEVFSHQV